MTKATATRHRQEKNEEIAAPGDENFADKEAQSLALIRSVFNDGRGEVNIIVGVYVVVQPPGKAAYDEWMFDCDLTELDNLRTRLRDDFGPGRYRCRVKKDGQPFSQYDLRIAANPRQVRTQTAAGAIASPIGGAAPGEMISPAMAAFFDRQERMLSALLERLTPAVAVSPAASMKETLELMKAMREAMPAPAPAANNGFEMLQKGIDLATKFGAGGGGETGWLDFLKGIIESPAIGGAIANLTRPAPQQHPGQNFPPVRTGTPAPLPMHRPSPAEPPAPAGASAAGAAAPGTPAAMLAPVIDLLIGNALQGMQPDLCADWVLENVPDDAITFLESKPDPVAYLVEIFPAVAPHRAWFAKLIASFYDNAGDAVEGADDGVRVHEQQQQQQPAPDARNTGRGGRNARSAQTHAGGNPQG